MGLTIFWFYIHPLSFNRTIYYYLSFTIKFLISRIFRKKKIHYSKFIWIFYHLSNAVKIRFLYNIKELWIWKVIIIKNFLIKCHTFSLKFYTILVLFIIFFDWRWINMSPSNVSNKYFFLIRSMFLNRFLFFILFSTKIYLSVFHSLGVFCQYYFLML